MLAAGHALLRRRTGAGREPVDRTDRMPWRMPPLDTAMAVLKACRPPSAAMRWHAAGEGTGIQAGSGSRAGKWVQDERRADVLR